MFFSGGIYNPLAFKLAFHEEQIYKCLFENIKYDATISKIEMSSVFARGTFAEIPLFGATTKLSLSFISNEFRSVTHSSQTRVLHEVALSVFYGILASYLV